MKKEVEKVKLIDCSIYETREWMNQTKGYIYIGILNNYLSPCGALGVKRSCWNNFESNTKFKLKSSVT